jgi:hypothetical protein
MKLFNFSKIGSLIGVTKATVERLLNKYGLKYRTKRKMHAMSEENKEDRFMM